MLFRSQSRYVTEEDKEPTIYGDIPTECTKSVGSKSDIVAEMIMSGSGVEEIMKQMPGYVLQNLAKINSFKSYYTIAVATQSKRSLDMPIRYTGTHGPTQSIVDWLNGNLNCTRSFKQPQLWIYGPPNSLKTTFLLKLQEYLRIYQLPMDEDFYDSYDDNAFDAVFGDEVYTQKLGTDRKSVV